MIFKKNDENSELTRFKSEIKAIEPDYTPAPMTKDDLKFNRSRIEMEIKILENNRTIQIAGPLFSLMPMILITISLARKDFDQSFTLLIASFLIIFFIYILLIIEEMRKLSKIRELLKRLLVINNLIEGTSESS